MKKIPQKTVTRALLYIRTLESLLKQQSEFVSSEQLASLTGITAVQIRKDIANFKKVGKPRVGYKISKLKEVLENFVLQGGVVRAVLFGAGHLGTAILKYPGFHKDRLQLVAAFDVDPKKVGRKINDVLVYPSQRAAEIIHKNDAKIGILAVPAESSQKVADFMVASGLRGIVNFAPVAIKVRKGVRVKDIDLTIEFLSLFCDARS